MLTEQFAYLAKSPGFYGYTAGFICSIATLLICMALAFGEKIYQERHAKETSVFYYLQLAVFILLLMAGTWFLYPYKNLVKYDADVFWVAFACLICAYMITASACKIGYVYCHCPT